MPANPGRPELPPQAIRPVAERRHALRPPAMDEALLSSVASHLEDFASDLPESERAALAAVLKIGTRNPALVALAKEPPEAVLEPEEVEIYRRLAARPLPREEGVKPYVVLVMKATRYCNLRCTYCRFWADGPNQRMSFEVLARATQSALTTPGVRAIDFCWHGGEATILPLGFYRKALWLQEQFRQPGQAVTNSLQTNATRLTPEWLRFLKRYGFSVGVSLDGPPEIHDKRRLDVRGRPTSERVREGIERLREHDIAHGVLMVVDDDVVALGPERLIEYMVEIGVDDVAILNVIPDNDVGRDAYYEFSRHVDFLRGLFRAWWPDRVDQVRFRELADLAGKIRGNRGTLCIFDGNCMGGYLTIEPHGEIAACDKYLGDSDYVFGNVLDVDIAQLGSRPSFVQANRYTETGVEGTGRCRWFDVCKGGCPHDRYLRARKSTPWDESCCGLEPLLSEMAEILARHPET